MSDLTGKLIVNAYISMFLIHLFKWFQMVYYWLPRKEVSFKDMEFALDKTHILVQSGSEIYIKDF